MLRLRRRILGLASRLLGLDDSALSLLRNLVDLVNGLLNKLTAVHVVRADILLDLVLLDRCIQVLVAFGVHIVGEDEDALPTCWHGKRPDARHDICDNFSRLEHADESGVFRLELAVPVHLGVVELEDAIVLLDLDVHILGSAENLVGKCSELRVAADIVHLVDNGANLGVLVEDDLCDDLLIGEVLFLEVEVRCEGQWLVSPCYFG